MGQNKNHYNTFPEGKLYEICGSNTETPISPKSDYNYADRHGAGKFIWILVQFLGLFFNAYLSLRSFY